MESKSKILYRLITKGECEFSQDVDVNELDNMLRPMGFEVILWPDRSSFILRDLSVSSEISLPWKKSTVEEAIEVFTKIAHDAVFNYKIPDLLIEHGWVKYQCNGLPMLTRRALVQFDDFLVSLGGKYKRCKLCTLLVDTEDYHDYCMGIISGHSQANAVI